VRPILVSRLKSTGFEAVLNPDSELTCGNAINEPGTMQFTLRGEKFFDQYNTENVLRTNAEIALYDETTSTYLWRGYVAAANADRTNYRVSLSCADSYAAVRRAVAVGSGGALVGELFATSYIPTSSYYSKSLLPLQTLAQTGTASVFNRWFYPVATDTDVWEPYTGTYKTLKVDLSADAADTDTTLAANTTDLGMLPIGLLHVDGSNEIVYYGLYDKNDLGTYEFQNCLRECLGTSAASPTATGTDLYQAKSKPIHPGYTPVVVGHIVSPEKYTVIDPGNYDVNYDEGRIEFKIDPLNGTLTPAGDSPYDDIQIYYWVYQVSAAATYILGGNNTYGLIEQLLQGLNVLGGPELATSSFDIVLDRLVVTRLYTDAPMLLGEALDELLAGPGGQLLRNLASDVQMLGAWWDYAQNKLIVRQLPLTSAAVKIQNYAALSERVDLRNVLSGVAVSWEDIYAPPEERVRQARFVRVTGTYPDADPGVPVYKTTPRVDVAGAFRVPRADVLDAGMNSTAGAVQMARQQLNQSLRRARTRTYTLRHHLDAFPALGTNYTMPDAFTGTCTRWEMKYENDAPTWTLQLCNLTEEYT
jgi:hypothetical protein